MIKCSTNLVILLRSMHVGNVYLMHILPNINAFTEQALVALDHCSNIFSRNIVVK